MIHNEENTCLLDIFSWMIKTTVDCNDNVSLV